MDAANQQAHDYAMALLRKALAPKYDRATLDAAEKVVLDRIPRTKWAADARLLKMIAADIRKLGDMP